MKVNATFLVILPYKISFDIRFPWVSETHETTLTAEV